MTFRQLLAWIERFNEEYPDSPFSILDCPIYVFDAVDKPFHAVEDVTVTAGVDYGLLAEFHPILVIRQLEATYAAKKVSNAKS